MKQHQNRRLREPEFAADPDFAEALCGDGSESNRLSAERQAQRKARQLCRQVHQALTLALAGRSSSAGGGDTLSALFVEAVTPAPDCGRLLVEVAIPEGWSAGEAMAALRRETPRLRSEVAMAITRKRAPELTFVPITTMGAGADE